MSKKRPFYEPRICYVDGDKGKTLWNGKRGTGAGLFYPRRVRVTDARELTPEKAVEKVLQMRLDSIHVKFRSRVHDRICSQAKAAGMTATITNGKVRVRKIKEPKR